MNFSYNTITVDEVLHRLNNPIGTGEGGGDFSFFSKQVDCIISSNMKRLLKEQKKTPKDFLDYLGQRGVPLKKETLYRYLKDRSATDKNQIPIGILLAFSEYVNEPISILLANPDVAPKKSVTPEMECFLRSFLGDNKKYAYDTNAHSKAFDLLLNNNNGGCEYVCYWLPPFTTSEKKPHGRLELYAEDNVCKASLVIHEHSVDVNNLPTNYKGFAVIIEPKTNRGTCWIFLRQEGVEAADVLVMSFRVRDGEKNDIRLAEVLTLASRRARPTVLRFLLTQNPININEADNQYTDYLQSILSFASKEIVISVDDFESVVAQIKETDILKSSLVEIGRKALEKKQEVIRINSTDIEKLNAPNITRLLRMKDITPRYNKISSKADSTASNVVSEMIEMTSTKQINN